MAAPLTQKGMKIGIILGTAYLFTQEAVDSKAIHSCFQDVAVSCQDTVCLTTSLGHSSRCAETEFVDSFFNTSNY